MPPSPFALALLLMGLVTADRAPKTGPTLSPFVAFPVIVVFMFLLWLLRPRNRR